jgi:hypothetical protein
MSIFNNLSQANKNMNLKRNFGMPIHFESVSREVADCIEEEDIDAGAWHPSNKAAQKLWRILECLRDLDELIEGAAHQKNATKKKRRLKIATTQLYSLVSNLGDLINDINCNGETSKLLNAEQLQQVEKIGRQFESMVPHAPSDPLSIVRNKLSSHVDKKIYPTEARKIASVVIPSEFGRWLHVCLHLVLDLIKLDIYWWSCASNKDGYIRHMSCEPYIATFRVSSGTIEELAGLHISKNSPKNSVTAVVNSLIIGSQWMFKPGQPRIGSLIEDKKENWNTFLGNHTLSCVNEKEF